MPNWVHNSLTITGDAARVQAVKTRLAQPYERVFSRFVDKEYVTETEVIEREFSLWNMVKPEGEELEKYNESLSVSAVVSFWYDWNCKNWGTKWDTEASFAEYGKDHLHYTFSTAWSPPIEAITALSSQFPDIHFELEWEEEQGFGGTVVFSEGNSTETEYYDIPSSHEELMERKDYCYCEDGEKVFEDCPIEEITPDMIVPRDEILIEQMM
jgi:hypothetical protein